MMESLIQRVSQLATRLAAYLRNEPLEVIVEIAIIWALVYIIFRFLRGTRGARAIKGMLLLLVTVTIVVKVLGSQDAFARLNFLYRNFLTFASLALVIVFQPELRRALVRLGEARFLDLGLSDSLRKARVIEEVLGSVGYLSKNKIGALVAFERQVGLRHIVEGGGVRLDSAVSKDLLNTLFWPGSALHDMGVVIQRDRVLAAGVQFPLAEGEMFAGTDLGSRHRAAVGLSQETDALVVVVSEETGTISLAERGRLHRPLTIDSLRTLLVRGMGKAAAPSDDDEVAAADADLSST